MKINITGDTHGKPLRFSELFIPNEKQWTKDNMIIVCGDWGMIFRDDEEEEENLDKLEKEKPYTICFADGNHENFTKLNSYPVKKMWGGLVHQIRHNIFHLMRGEVYEIDGKKIFVFGGAYSTDRSLRQLNISYWKEELPNNAEYKKAIQNLAKHNNTVDYIITHQAPQTIIRTINCFPLAKDAELTGFLDWVYHDCSFTHWYCGHWHRDIDINDKFSFMYYDVKSLE